MRPKWEQLCDEVAEDLLKMRVDPLRFYQVALEEGLGGLGEVPGAAWFVYLPHVDRLVAKVDCGDDAGALRAKLRVGDVWRVDSFLLERVWSSPVDLREIAAATMRAFRHARPDADADDFSSKRSDRDFVQVTNAVAAAFGGEFRFMPGGYRDSREALAEGIKRLRPGADLVVESVHREIAMWVRRAPSGVRHPGHYAVLPGPRAVPPEEAPYPKRYSALAFEGWEATDETAVLFIPAPTVPRTLAERLLADFASVYVPTGTLRVVVGDWRGWGGCH